MIDVLEEVTSESITRADVDARLNNWVERLDTLYSLIQGWLPPEWQADRQRTVRMEEELMRKFAVPAREIPVLFLSSADGRSATLEPRGLWIIGFNGRVDLFVDRKHYLIVDTAKNFAIPKWRIADFAQRDNIKDLDRNSFLAALAA